MKYHEKEMNCKSALSFWQSFNLEERVLFYNPLDQKLIVAAKRLKTFREGESHQQFPYIFSSRTFFPSVKDSKWEGLGNETIAFEYYFVEKNGKQTLYYLNDWPEMMESEPVYHRHAYKVPTDDYGEWKELFHNVKQEIVMQKVKKVVISREVKIECDTSVSIESLLKRLMENNPNSFIFAYFKEGKTFLGATPEILVQKEKEQLRSYALAGTISRRGQEDDENQRMALLNDPKNRHEHRLVVEGIAKVMKTYTDEVIIGETTTLALKNLYHLRTPIRAKVNENSSLTDWVTRLHPTPALGGYPVQKALEIIARFEKHERGLYAAPFGMMNEQGDGLFVVGIRSALIEGNRVYAYAGCGIVEDSECEAEYWETQNKVKTIIESLSDDYQP